MMISHREVSGAAQSYLHELRSLGERQARPGAQPREASRDDVVISEKAQDVRAWVERLTGLPESRSDRLDELARQVQAGAYRPSALDIADQILARSLGDRLSRGPAAP
ncbi:MAG: flagellar biosynthesis anti-sigma factor FlgM [Clostridia bacterium]|nr:flagellar biosynthesis anti-sigma factor FlgM [Clostridia bacterium]